MSLINMRTDFPNALVTALKSSRVVSVCSLNFANACHVARSNRSVLSSVFSLGVRSRPLKTGRAHYV